MRLLVSLACAALLAGTLTSAGAAYLDASEARAQVNGYLSTRTAGDFDTGDGSAPLSVATEYIGDPGSGPFLSASFTAGATAAVGSLGARADLAIKEALRPGFVPAYEARADASASFIDEWTFTDQPFDSRGTLRLTSRFEGSAFAQAAGAAAQAHARYMLDVTALGEFDNIVDFDTYNSPQLQLADETIVFEVDFLYGRPVLVQGSLFALVQFDSLAAGAYYSGEGFADFGNTASLTRLEVAGADGVFSDAYALSTLSGGLYPFQSPVPEPASAALFAFGALGLGSLRLAAKWRRRMPVPRIAAG